MSSYDERRKALEAGYRARQEGRKEAQQRKEQVLDRQMELLEQERESAGRDSYIRQQQQLTALPEQLNAYGINGGGAETSLLKINTEYNQA
jgi:methylphosphotriester-DNA--protein-cysteine methyltransferase